VDDTSRLAKFGGFALKHAVVSWRSTVSQQVSSRAEKHYGSGEHHPRTQQVADDVFNFAIIPWVWLRQYQILPAKPL
jgi:hypothetical protein